LTRYQANQLLAGRSKGFVLGKYRILDQIGHGGMGFVLKALHVPMDRVVAIKIMRPAAENRHDLQLFEREMLAAARLHHPNIVTGFDASQARGVHYLVMEYVDGPNLDKLVRRRGPLPYWLAWELLRQATEALQYAHERGIVHRDIKPANLLVTRIADWRAPDRHGSQLAAAQVADWKPTLKILDFGLARLHAPQLCNHPVGGTIMVQPGELYGTPDFVSPEQAHDLHAADIRSDLYSLGCAFYFALSGRVPFPGSTIMEKLIKHSVEEPEPLERLRPDLPPAAVGVIRRLMAKDPAQRYQTPAELADTLAPRSTLASRSGTVETKINSAVNTPAGTDADLGAGWVFDDFPPELEELEPVAPGPSAGKAPPSTSVREFLSRYYLRRRRLRFWLTAGLCAAAASLVGWAIYWACG
jgi:serine/threonine protein kinase